MEQLRVHLHAADERVPNPEDVVVYLRRLCAIPKFDVDNMMKPSIYSTPTIYLFIFTVLDSDATSRQIRSKHGSSTFKRSIKQCG